MRLIATIGPALAPHRVRLVGWWDERSQRERRLLAVLGTLAAIVLVAMLIVRPLQAARAQALADIRTYRTLNERLLAAGPVQAGGVPRRTGDAVAIASAAAAANGLVLSGVIPAANGAEVRIDRQSYDAVVRWLADLAASSDLRARRIVTTQAADPGTVDARVVLAR